MIGLGLTKRAVRRLPVVTSETLLPGAVLARVQAKTGVELEVLPACRHYGVGVSRAVSAGNAAAVGMDDERVVEVTWLRQADQRLKQPLDRSRGA